MTSEKSKSLGEIATLINGDLSDNKHKGLVVKSVAATPDNATEDDLVIIYNEKYFKDVPNIKALAFVLPENAKSKLPSLESPVVWVKRPRIVLKLLLEALASQKFYAKPGIHKTSNVDPTSKIGKNVSIGANVFIGPNCFIGENTVVNPNVYIGSNVSIGKGCIIHANCSIMDYSRIENNVILHSGAVIGSDGYSYVTEEESNLEKAKKGDRNFNLGRQIQHKIPSLGSVIIEEDVEIGANSCVDAGTMSPTIIGAGTKIDNLVQIAHNCNIGKDCLIVAQVGLAGSINIGDRVVAGGQCGFADNITIGNDVVFVARSGVHGNIPANSVYMGTPAVPYMEFMRGEKDKKRIPRRQEKLEEQVKQLEEKVKELEAKLGIKV